METVLSALSSIGLFVLALTCFCVACYTLIAFCGGHSLSGSRNTKRHKIIGFIIFAVLMFSCSALLTNLFGQF